MGLSKQASDCTIWIKKELEATGRYSITSSSDDELLDILSDGEILCTLVAEVSGGMVSADSNVYFSANSHIMAKKNLEFFLRQCRDIFHLEQDDLFEPEDLLTMSNSDRVWKTILKLASTVEESRKAVRKADEAKPKQIGQEVVHIIKEVCDHEKALLIKLEQLLKYRKELLSLLSEWTTELVDMVFKYTEPLYHLHQEMWTKMTELAGEGCKEFCLKLAPLIIKMEPKLELYIEFYSHLPLANLRMEKDLAESPRLSQQLVTLEAHFPGLSFRGLYDGPVRQITNYQMLFTRLRVTAKQELSDECSNAVEAAAQRIGALAERANTFKKQVEALAATESVLSQVNGLPQELKSAETTGLLLADELLRVRKDRKAEAQLCLCVLTTKNLIVASTSRRDVRRQSISPAAESQATYWFHIPVSSSLEVMKMEKKNEKESGCFDIVVNGGEAVHMKSQKMGTSKWVQLLNEAKDTNYPAGSETKGHNFELKTLPQGSTCSKCTQPLEGKVMQGYSCSHCNRQFDRQCFLKFIRYTAEDFYHRNLNRAGSEELLKNKAIGTFLIRDSNNPGIRAISIKNEKKIEHIIINESPGKCSMGCAQTFCRDLDGLLDFYRATKLSVNFASIDCFLGEGVPVEQIRAAGRQDSLLKTEL